MATILSGRERTQKTARCAALARSLVREASVIAKLDQGMWDEGNSPSTISTQINALLVDWGAMRDQLVTELQAIGITHQERARIGSPHTFNSAVIEAANQSNTITSGAACGLIRANTAQEIIVAAGPFSKFLANDIVTIVNAEDRSNLMSAAVRYTPADGGVDLISNGGFSSDTLWTKGVGWTISGGVANATTLSTVLSQAKADMIAAGATWTNGVRYLVTFTLATSSAGTLSVGTNTTAAQHTVTAAATHRAIILSDGNAAGLKFTGASWTGTIDNVSLIPLSGLALNDVLGSDNSADTKLEIVLSER